MVHVGVVKQVGEVHVGVVKQGCVVVHVVKQGVW